MKKQRAFTIIELLVVIAVLGLLASIILISLKGTTEKAKIAKAQAEVNQLRTAVYQLALDTGKWPGGWQGPYISLNDFIDPWGKGYWFDPDYYPEWRNDQNEECPPKPSEKPPFIQAIGSYGLDRNYFTCDDIFLEVEIK